MKKKTIIAGWAVLSKEGEWMEQVSTIMSPALRKFYGNSKHVMLVPCTIIYQLPAPQKNTH